MLHIKFQIPVNTDICCHVNMGACEYGWPWITLKSLPVQLPHFHSVCNPRSSRRRHVLDQRGLSLRLRVKTLARLIRRLSGFSGVWGVAWGRVKKVSITNVLLCDLNALQTISYNPFEKEFLYLVQCFFIWFLLVGKNSDEIECLQMECELHSWK